MSEAITEDDVRDMLLLYIRRNFKTQKKYAEHKGLSTSYISGIIRGRNSVPLDMLSELGLSIEIRRTPEQK
jgi:plasmid maintenance system antidote protein VapI